MTIARSHPGEVLHVWDHFVLTLRAGQASTTLSLYAITWSPEVGTGHVAILSGTDRPTTIYQDQPGIGERMRRRLLAIGSPAAGLAEASTVDAIIERHPVQDDTMGFAINSAAGVLEATWASLRPPVWTLGPAPAFWEREDIWAVMIEADAARLTLDGVAVPGAPFPDDAWIPKVGRPLSSAHIALAEVRVKPVAAGRSGEDGVMADLSDHFDGAVHDDTGVQLDAHFSLGASPDGYELVHEARWGGRGASSIGNRDYAAGLGLLLGRLGSMGALLLDATVDSAPMRTRPHDDRALDLGATFPVRIHEHDPETLRLALSRAQSAIGRAPGARGSGNSTRRILLRFALPDPGPSAMELGYRLATGRSGEVAEVGAAVDLVAGRASGQGFARSAEERAILEHWGMTRVTLELLDEGWPKVDDVSARESFDLLCLGPGAELRVEVKATRGTAAQVLVTRAEVLHARLQTVHLAIVAGVRLVRASPGPIVASGGEVTWHRPWSPREDELTPLAYAWRASSPERLRP
ncbi:MAG: hypothetical protein KF809_06500 [Chloroflexi bacterium]|nr:hypothetical protein [Chloroflexota bacterium]